MLVLTRKAHQKIQIGENVTITVIEVKGRYVRIGIEAPRELRIVRGEIRHELPVVQPSETRPTAI